MAEVGSNWQFLEDCIYSIDVVSSINASCAKFQLFTKNDLYGMGHTIVPGYSPYLNPNWLPHLQEHCVKKNIDFMCTAFSVEGIEAVDPYVKQHKLASSDLTHIEMLEKLNLLGKPVVISTGGATLDEISSALDLLSAVPTTLCYCVSSYPSHEYNLFVLTEFYKRFSSSSVQIGFSDHSLDFYPCISAFNHFGVSYIEKHFKAHYHFITPDSPHSLGPEEFSRMIELIHDPFKLSSPGEEEKEFVGKHKRRLVAIDHVRPGDKLRLNENFGIYRSTIEDNKYISGLRAHEFEGKIAKNNSLPGYCLLEEDFE